MAARPDLAAMLFPLSRALVQQVELPILRAHDLSMWAYGVLLGLEESPVRTQAALATAIGADKTRIIPVLDDLESRGLISRTTDPADRRARYLSLTPAGRMLRDSAQAAIQAKEDMLLAQLPPPDRDTFLRALETLHTLPVAEITGSD